MTTHEIVKKIVGPIVPVGQTDQDKERFANLEDMCTLVNKLLYDISKVSDCRNSHEYSVSLAGNYAYSFLREIKEADL